MVPKWIDGRIASRLGSQEGGDRGKAGQDADEQIIVRNLSVIRKLSLFYWKLTIPIRLLFETAGTLLFFKFFFLAFGFCGRAVENSGGPKSATSSWRSSFSSSAILQDGSPLSDS
jgi:hypothetical protein